MKLTGNAGWWIGLRLGRLVACVGILLLASTTIHPVRAQDVIAPGQNKDGAIEAGKTNTHTFTATMGDRIVLQMAKLSGGAGFTPLMQLFAPDGTRLGAEFGLVAARLDVQAVVPGSYSVVVSDLRNTGAGTYRLQLVQFPGTVPVPANDEGGPLVNGESKAGTIDVGDLDPWTFTANAGDRVVLQIAKVAGGAGFAPMIELFGPDGVRLAIAGEAVAARVDVQAVLAGAYTVLVSDVSPSGSGGYELRLAQVPGPFTTPANDDGGDLRPDVDRDGTITLGDMDLWSFTIEPGSKVTVQLTELSGGAGFTPKLEVFTPIGSRKAFSQNASAAMVEFATEETGPHTLLISDATRSGTGTYRLRFSRVALAPLGANLLVSGGVVIGEIASAREDDQYTFIASAGESIVLRVAETTAGSTLVPQVRLFDPSGLLDSGVGQIAGEAAARAASSGTFSVSVRDNNGGVNVGGYRLSFVKTGSPLTIAPSDEGGTLTNGTTYIGAIDVGDLDAWTIHANAGDTLVVRMGESAPALNPQLRIFDPSGTQLEAVFGAAAAEVSVRTTNSGAFLVVAGDQTAGFAGSGNYRLSMAKTGSPLTISASDEGGALTNGVTYLASIEVGDIDAWTIHANAGENIIVRMGELTASLVPQLRIYDPSGRELDSRSAASATEVSVRATNSGAFLVIAGDLTSGWAGSGNYRLSMAKTGSPLTISASDEGGTLTNGVTYLGSIEVGDIDAWTINATAGENIIVRMGEMTAGMLPQLRLFDPSGAQLDVGFAATAAEVSARATNSGAFLLVAGDLTSGWAGSGNYRLSMAKTGSPLTISGSDEGGALVNGTTYLGTIETGDLDAWTIDAKAGETIIVRMGEITTGTLTPQLRIFDPSGPLLASELGAVASEVVTRATNSGPFLVVATDLTSGWAGTGNYRLVAAKTGTPIVISTGQEGGPMSGSATYEGNLEVGALDAWSFTACAGDTITLNVRELVNNSPLTPHIRLYGRNGVELRSLVNAVGSEFTLAAPASGTYTIVIGDRSSGWAGSGGYRLTATGLIHNLRICIPMLGAAPVVVGGLPGAALTVLTSTNVLIPLSQWTAATTGQFDEFGVFTINGLLDTAEPYRFFQVRTP